MKMKQLVQGKTIAAHAVQTELEQEHAAIESHIASLIEQRQATQMNIERVNLELAIYSDLLAYEEEAPPQTPPPKAIDTDRLSDLGPTQRAAYELLPDTASDAVSCSEVRNLLNEQGRLIKRNTAVHKVLLSLEQNRLATFKKIGVAFYWYKYPS